MIELKDITYQYHNDDALALDHISISFKKGEFVSILGHNGSGKSTLIKIIMGILKPTSGDIFIHKKKINQDNPFELQSHFSIVFQNPDNQFVGATVMDDVAFGLENLGVPHETMVTKVEAALKEVDMWDFRNHEPHKLSGGQKQRVAIAGALVTNPEVLIMDEATSMLDPEGRVEVLSLLKKIHTERNTTILYITHDLREIENSDYVFILKKGQIVSEGTIQKIYEEPEILISSNLELPYNIKLSQALCNEAYMSYEEVVASL